MQYLTKLRTFAEKLHDTLFWKNVLQFGIKENNRYAIKSGVFCCKKNSMLFHKAIVKYVPKQRKKCGLIKMSLSDLLESDRYGFDSNACGV